MYEVSNNVLYELYKFTTKKTYTKRKIHKKINKTLLVPS